LASTFTFTFQKVGHELKITGFSMR